VGARGRPAPVVAAAAAAAVIALKRDAEALALLCADCWREASVGPPPFRCSQAKFFSAAPRARGGGRSRASQAGTGSQP
jgi:hypothetical protein